MHLLWLHAARDFVPCVVAVPMTRRQAHAAAMCWHMLGGPGVLWTVAAESRSVGKGRRRKVRVPVLSNAVPCMSLP